MRWDYDDESEAMKALREKYDFNSDESHALPGYMVIDADGGDVVYRADSYMEPEVFLMMGRIALGHAETSIESLERFRSGGRDVGFLNEFLGKFPLLFLADHFPADEQHRLVPVLLEAADSYLRQLTREDRFTAINLHRLSILLQAEQGGQGRFASVDGFIESFDGYQAVYEESPPKLFAGQYDSLAPICMDILVSRAAYSR